MHALHDSYVNIYLKVGFNAGDGNVFFTVNASRSPDIINVDVDSNVETPGKFAFRIDASDISDGGCNTEGIYQFINNHRSLQNIQTFFYQSVFSLFTSLLVNVYVQQQNM